MYKKLFYLLLFVVTACFTLSCSNNSDDEDYDIKGMVLSSHIDDMKSFSWKRLEYINGKYMFLASYGEKEDYLSTTNADVTFFIGPTNDKKHSFKITSASFLSRKNGRRWFLFENDDDCGYIDIVKGETSDKITITLTKLFNRNNEYVKNVTLVYYGKIKGSSMLEY